MQDNSLDMITIDQMKTVLDHAPVGVFVCAVESKKLLYLNRLAREMFLLDSNEGLTCYQAAGFDGPCDFCRIEKMGKDELITRKYRHSDNQHTYQLNGKLINWEGSLAHIEYITDVTETQRQEEQERTVREELIESNDKMKDIINAIPGGVAVYRVSDILETIYFSDGVPELTGYSVGEYANQIRCNAADMIYWEDKELVLSKVKEVIKTHNPVKFEYRKQHREGHIVWVRIQITWIGEEEGYPFLCCVFHNISDLKSAQLEMNHLINSLPGGIASYRVEGERFIPTYFSDGVMDISGHTREEYEDIVRDNALNIIYEGDRERVLAGAKSALENGEVLDISYRILHKEGYLVWVKLNGRRMGPLGDSMSFYAVFSGMSAEARLFKSIINETTDSIYVVGKENYELLYVNENNDLYKKTLTQSRQKCYEVIHGKTEPCEFCTLKKHAPDGRPHEIYDDAGKTYSTHFRETNWNGIAAYVKYVQDVTQETKAHKEKEHLEQYYQNVIRYLPGGIAVIRYDQNGDAVPEFLSEGFAKMTGMSLDDAWDLYRRDAMMGLHPDDKARVESELDHFMTGSGLSTEMIYRLQKGNGSYVWVKNSLTVIKSEDGVKRVYADYHDITKEREEQEQLRQQYNELIMQHYKTPGPNALIVGHCNVTENRILEIIDYTNSDLLASFGTKREEFFTGISGLLVDPVQRQNFLNTYLNAPSLAAFERGCFEVIQNCYIKLPREELGHYVEFKVNLVETPDTGHVTGILTVTDTTEQTITDRILQQLSVASYDMVVDVDILKDTCILITDKTGGKALKKQEVYTHALKQLVKVVLPKDAEHVDRMLNPEYIRERLNQDGTYSFSYSLNTGEIRTKCMTVFATDLNLGRVCLASTDITDSVREQQRLLNVIAYTFELLALIDVESEHMTMYTRQMVLDNLPPFDAGDYNQSIVRIQGFCDADGGKKEITRQFKLETLLKSLKEQPLGYDFVQPFHTEEGIKYKKVSVLWGDANCKTVCMVRADVTDILEAEHRSQKAMEKALLAAEEANQAKSDFLSSMSHDIRTPMNAIMGMTALATAHINDRSKVEDCLKKISFSSKHLLSLVNDILDMSKIERSKITLNRMEIYLPDLVEQLSSIMMPQAKEAGLQLEISLKNIEHRFIYGDSLRINQILINILGNAIKFTPEGGSVEFCVEETVPCEQGERVRYRFIIRDTGVGMSEEFLSHIFEPFTRSKNAFRIEGSGLGLSITHGLVNLMKGEISVESKELKGTAFCIELEFDAVEEAAQRVTSETDTELFTKETERILADKCFLVAEDNAINSEILCELLLMCGVKTVVKTDGRQAVQAFQSAEPGTYDAVLMDIQMPEMNGYEATRAIRAMERPDARSIPIVAMTANAFTEDVQESMDAGMNAHVAKPIDLQVLQATLSKLLAKTDIN